jgi:hypothetical protein
VQSAESEYVAQNLVTLAEDKATEVLKLVDAPEQDEDVQRVFHNLGETKTPVSLFATAFAGGCPQREACLTTHSPVPMHMFCQALPSV